MPKMGIIEPIMGTIGKVKSMQPNTGLGDALFTKTQQRVLGYFFGHPERSYFANEIIKLTGAGSGAVQRELKRLTESGLLLAEKRGNQKHFKANENSPIFTELGQIVQKTFGLAVPLRNALADIAENIQCAFVFGSIAKHTDTAASDIDLMIVSDSLSYPEIMTLLVEAEAKLGRHINPTLYTAQEMKSRLAEGNAFLTRVLQQPKIWVIGNETDLSA